MRRRLREEPEWWALGLIVLWLAMERDPQRPAPAMETMKMPRTPAVEVIRL